MPLTYARKTVRDIYVTVYRGWVKQITKFTKSTYLSFVACRRTVPPSSQRKVSARFPVDASILEPAEQRSIVA
jgi:hypothetical protein